MMDSLLLYKILKNRTGAEISASGNPAIMTNALKNNPMNEMKVFGWSKQETTKGKNLFDFSRLVSDGVNVMDYDNQTITVPARTNNTGYNQTLRDLCPGITPGTYAFSAKRSNPESGNGSYFLEAGLDFPFNVPTELTDALLDNHIAWYNNPDSEVENVISEIQIEIGTEATDYEPYTGGQPSPSPDYPQEIVSAGANREICIEVRGKNLVNISDSEFAGTKSIPISLRKGTYWFTVEIGDDNEKPVVAIMLRKDMESVAFYNNLTRGKQNKIRINLSDNVDEIILYAGIDYKDSLDCKGVFKNIMISVDKPTAYEPYHEPQSLFISTPTGLPAIPVDSDGNYIDANGQQWIADYVDLKRGKYVQNICKLPLKNLVKKWYTWGVNNLKGNITGFYAYLADAGYQESKGMKVLTNICRYHRDVWGGANIGCNINDSNQYVEMSLPTDILEDTSANAKAIESFAKIIEQTDAYMMYVLADPIERDLTPEEIEAYKNLVTYAGTTIVENDAECYMEVSAGGGDALRAKKLALILGE